MKTLHYIMITLMVFVFAGCNATHSPTPMPLLTQPEMTEANPVYNPGSLYDASQSEFLYGDNRARRVGDIVNVIVSENSKAKHKADSDASKENTTTYGVSGMSEGGAMGLIPLASQFALGAGNPSMNLESSSEFKGSGQTTNENSFNAKVAARIVRMLPGRVMQVEGARRIRVNDETQILVVKGLVRSRDIRADNSVYSYELAEAQVEVYGDGVISDQQNSGWLIRVLNNIMPF
ncbi:MAG: flagellar basal body L-ring protein FlgH [Desulfovibrio sp.]